MCDFIKKEMLYQYFGLVDEGYCYIMDIFEKFVVKPQEVVSYTHNDEYEVYFVKNRDDAKYMYDLVKDNFNKVRMMHFRSC